MRAKLLAAILALSVPALSAIPSARASLVEALDLASLVEEADSVVLARVIKSWSHYDDRGRIVTDYQMQVERAEKGDTAPGAAVVVRKLGGIVGDRGMTISGEPGYEDNELVLLFGKNGKAAYLRPVGMGQGAMRIIERDGVRWVRSDARGMSLVRKGNTQKSAAPGVAEARSGLRVRADDHGVRDRIELLARHAHAARVLADRLAVCGLVDAERAHAPVRLVDHVASDPAHLVGHLLLADAGGRGAGQLELGERPPGTGTTNDVELHDLCLLLRPERRVLKKA